MQDHPNFYIAVGLPVLFTHVERRDPATQTSERVAQGYIRRNQIVSTHNDIAAGPANVRFVEPRIRWFDPIIGLTFAALVLMGLTAIADRLIGALT